MTPAPNVTPEPAEGSPVVSPANGGPAAAASRSLALLSTVSRILDPVVDDFDGAAEAVANACVPAFADLCALEVTSPEVTGPEVTGPEVTGPEVTGPEVTGPEMTGPDREVRTVACCASPGGGLHLPEQWSEIVRAVAGQDQHLIAAGGAAEPPAVAAVRERLGAGSLLVVPIRAGGRTLGCLVAATGRHRPGFVESDLQVGGELGSRLGATIQRVLLYRQLQASAREHSQTAHDFNNLLTLILGYSELLSGGISDPQLRSLAGEIEISARRAAVLIQEMLDAAGRDGAALMTGPARHQLGGRLAGTDPDAAVIDSRDVQVVDAASLPAADVDAWPPERTMVGRILFVEDDPALRHAGQESLATVGLDVVAADSAEIAISILAGDASYDALVTDIALPGLSGVQLARAVRPTHPGLKVLYVTGYSGAPDRDHTPAPGEPVLRKPYRPDSLRLRVAELLAPTETAG